MWDRSSVPRVNNRLYSSEGFKLGSRSQWTPVAFEAGKRGRNIRLTTEPPPSADGKNGWNYTSTPSVCLQGSH